jgi:uncharacterized membrane protein
MQRNISEWERAGSIVAAAALAAAAASRRGRRVPAMLAAGGLFFRGLSGYCPASAAVGRNARRTDTREALSGPRGIHVKERITIARPVDEVYRFWRSFSNLPQCMTHLERVDEIDRTRSHWVVRGPAGKTLEWDAEVINDVPNQVIGWRSIGDADVISAGSVNFAPAPGGGTEVVVHLQYEPPAGRVGASLASLLGESPSRQIRQDLRRLKDHLEGLTPSPARAASETTEAWRPSSRWVMATWR